MTEIMKYIASLLDGDHSGAGEKAPDFLGLAVSPNHFDEPPPSFTAIDRVISELCAITERARDKRDRLGYFSGLYLATTRAVADGIRRGFFHNSKRMVLFDAMFAKYYFDALEKWNHGGQPSGPWHEAMTAASEREMFIVQHMLLGMNAHINLDLALVVRSLAKDGDLDGLHHDYVVVNQILRATIDYVQNVINAISPPFAVIDEAGGPMDEWLAALAIELFRDNAWDEGLALFYASPEEEAILEAKLEAKVTERARWVRSAHLLVPRVIRDAETDSTDDRQVALVLDRLLGLKPKV